MDLSWIYKSFFLRDGLGYVLPGSITLATLLCFGLEDPGAAGALAKVLPAWVIASAWVACAYAVAVILAWVGNWTRVLVTDANAGWFGDVVELAKATPTTCKARILGRIQTS